MSVKKPTLEQEALIKERGKARAEKDYDRADQLRAELEKTGMTILDTPDGAIWQYLI